MKAVIPAAGEGKRFNNVDILMCTYLLHQFRLQKNLSCYSSSYNIVVFIDHLQGLYAILLEMKCISAIHSFFSFLLIDSYFIQITNYFIFLV